MRLADLTDLADTQTEKGEEMNDDDAARVEGAPSSAEEILLEEKALVDDAEKDANATTAATNGGELVGDGNSAGDSSVTSSASSVRLARLLLFVLDASPSVD